MGWGLSGLIKIWNCFPDNYLCFGYKVLELGRVSGSYKSIKSLHRLQICHLLPYIPVFFPWSAKELSWITFFFFLSFLLNSVIPEQCVMHHPLSWMLNNMYKEGVVRKLQIPVFKYDSVNRSAPDTLLRASEGWQRPMSYTFCFLIRTKCWVEKQHWEGRGCEGRGLLKESNGLSR